MRSEHLERYFERFKNNLNKQSISYNDIAFMTENEKQYMEFFKKLSANSEIDINEDDVFKAVTETYIEYRTEFNQAYDKLEGQDLTIEEAHKIVTETIQNTLILLGKWMQDSNATEFLVKKHNRKYGSIDESLNVKAEDIEKSFEADKVKRYKITELYTTSIFWTNKFIKYINSLEEYSMYIKDTQGVMRSDIDLQDEDKMLYISYQKKKLIEKIYHECTSQEEREAMCKYFEQRYEEICEKNGCKRVSLEDDFNHLKGFEVIKEQLYVAKNSVVKSLLINLINDVLSRKVLKDVKNWGIEEDTKDKSKYILNIELPGYMLPVSVHVPKYHVREILKASEIESLDLPIFSIKEDFTDETGKFYGATIMYKPGEEQKKDIKNASKRKRNNKILMHIRNQTYDRPQVSNSQKLTINANEGDMDK